MQLPAQHLELVFLSSTVTAAWGTGWVYTTTPTPQPRPTGPNTTPLPLRLAVVGA